MLIYQDLALVTLGRDGRPLVRRGAAEAALAGAVLADLLRARRLRLDPVGRRGTLVLSLVPAPATGDAVLDAAVAALAGRRLRSTGHAVRSVSRGLSGRVRDALHRRGLATVTSRRSFLGFRTWRLADNDPAARSALRLRLGWRTVGAQLPAPPGEVEHEALGRGRRQARGRPDRAVDVLGAPADPADQVMVVVADPQLESGGGAGRLDAADKAGGAQIVEDVVDALLGDLGPRRLGADDVVEERGRGRMRVIGQRRVHRQPRRGDAQPGAAQLLLDRYGHRPILADYI